MKNVVVAQHETELAERGAEMFRALAIEWIEKEGRFMVALSGGKTPQGMYQILREMGGIDWPNIYVFWGDERFVLPDHPDSNFTSIYSSLLKHIPIPEKNIFPYEVRNTTPEESAKRYSHDLQKIFGKSEPEFHFLLLGIGPDGHTASLFPDLYHPESDESLILVVKDSPKPPALRLSFSLRLINNAQNVIMLVSGKEKAPILKRIFQDPEAKKSLPAAMINPQSGQLTWLIDQDAASFLN